MSGHWLNDRIPIPRWVAVLLIATTVFTVVNWALSGALWLLIHLTAD